MGLLIGQCDECGRIVDLENEVMFDYGEERGLLCKVCNSEGIIIMPKQTIAEKYNMFIEKYISLYNKERSRSINEQYR